MFGIQGTDRQFTYKGYEYRTYDDVEDDNIKMFHLCFKDGQEVKMPQSFYNHSPYSTWTLAEFKAIIDNQILVDFIQG